MEGLESAGDYAASELETLPELDLPAAGPESASDSRQQIPRSGDLSLVDPPAHLPENQSRKPTRARIRRRARLPPLFDMCVGNQLDPFSLADDVINRVPKRGARAAYAHQAIREKLLDHKSYIARYGDDMLEIRDWEWGAPEAGKSAKADTAAHNV
ncbi:MAG: hypothetical protein WBV90_02010 [Terrimicrobiaceae bacterium]